MVITVKVIPRARQNQVTRIDGRHYSVRLTAPPIAGAANDSLVSVLAKYFQVAKKQIEIMRGQRSRFKLIKIIDSF